MLRGSRCWDLHPGNILVDRDAKVVLLDLGLTAELDGRARRAFAMSFASWAAGDGNTMAGDGCDDACQSELPPEWLSAIKLEEVDRAATFNDGPGKITKCDTKTNDQWHCFLAPAGTVIPNVPPTQYSCGTDSPGWMMGDLPLEADGVVARTACFLWEGDPCTWSTEIQVRSCGDYYVFRLPNPPETCLRYCAAAG